MNISKTLKAPVIHLHWDKKTLFKAILWLNLLALPLVIHIYQKPNKNLELATNMSQTLSYLDEHIAYLLNEGKTYKQLKQLGYSNQEISGGFRELVTSRSPIPTISELENLGFKDQQIISNIANLLVEENLSVNDLDDMGFKSNDLMPKIIHVLVNDFHFSQNELEGVGFTPNEIRSSQVIFSS
jgi:hypothetical protein